MLRLKSILAYASIAIAASAFNLDSAYARELQTVRADREGFSVERLQRIDDHMARAVRDGVMVGGQALIARNGIVVYRKSWGQQDREAGLPMQEDAIFRIYSMTKPITGVALMMLFEEGKFGLNDPIAQYIPELANLEVAVTTAGTLAYGTSDGTSNRTKDGPSKSPALETRKPARQPTVRDLMRHTAGFTYGVFGDTEVDQLYRARNTLGPHADLHAFVTALGKLPLQYEPGQRWHYSVSVDVQGRLIEVLSGMRFGQFLQERIFDPLGMSDTSFTIAKRDLDRLAVLYTPKGTPGNTNAWLTPNATAELVVAPDYANVGYQPGATLERGGDGLLSTTSDYLRFCQMLLNGGELNGTRILAPRTIEMMRSNQLGGDIPLRDPGIGFGLNFGVLLDPGVAGRVGSVGEYRWGGAAGTDFWIDPVKNVIGIFMVQSMPHRTSLGRTFKALTYQALIH